MFKDLSKALNVENAKSRHSRGVQNVKEYGIAQDNAKLEIGQPIRQNAMKDPNNYNKCNKKQKVSRKLKNHRLPLSQA